MARFVLTPCRIREDKIVPDGDAVELDWPKVAALLAPSQTHQALTTLTRVRVNAFVGLVKAAKPKDPPTNFVFMNDNRSNEIGWLLKKNPNFPEQVEKLFRVDAAIFDAKIEEHSSGEPA